MLKPVDYDARQHEGYVAGRDLGPENRRMWAEVFAAQAPDRRPLAALDLGSGTGRFTGVLAETFGGPAWGVEPSDRMRAIAAERTGDARVSFLAGRAEAIPLPDGACDLVLMFLSFHHVQGRSAAVREIARVLRPGGRVLLRSQFRDRLPELAWHAFFPRARAIELEMFPPLADVEAAFAEADVGRLALVEVEEQVAPSLAEHAERLRHRAISTFEHMSEAEIREGFARLDAAVAAETTPRPVAARADLLVLGRD
jgi:ubiquinone/menaquinone biosynthesis C-methylase UbiE